MPIYKKAYGLERVCSGGNKQPSVVNLTQQQSLCHHQKDNSVIHMHLLAQPTEAPIRIPLRTGELSVKIERPVN